MLRKIGLYLLSLCLLFVFILIQTIYIPISFNQEAKFVGVGTLLINNIIPLISIVCLVVGLFAFVLFKDGTKGTTDIPFEIKKIENINYEHLVYMVTYVIPLICFDLTNVRQSIVLGLILLTQGIIYIRTDLFYANPTLALMGFHIYKVDGDFKHGERKDIVLISRNKLEINEKLPYIKLDDKILYVLKTKAK